MLSVSLEVFILLALIALNGVFAMAEIAVVSSRQMRLQQNAEKGEEGARAALALAKEPTRFLSTVQIGITLIGIFAGAFGGANLAARVATGLEDAGVSESLSETLGVVLVVLAITYLSLVFGELVPKRIGLHNPEKIASYMARPMQLLSRAASPVVAVLTFSTMAVFRLLGLGIRGDAAVSEEEIRMLIGMSAETGSVNEEEAELLDRVFHFGDRRLHEVMIPRTEATWVPKDTKLTDFFAIYTSAPHSRFPVYDGNPDKVAGILGIKEVLAAVARGEIGEGDSLAGLVRPAFFVPESKPIGELFREMQARGIQMAIAVDEFGGTAGIATLEKLLEEMVGNVFDEMGVDKPEFKTIDDRTVLVDGSLSVDEARDDLGLDIPEGDYDTVAGFVLDHLGHIPREGEQIPVNGWHITVSQMKGPKIEQLRVTRS